MNVQKLSFFGVVAALLLVLVGCSGSVGSVFYGAQLFKVVDGVYQPVANDGLLNLKLGSESIYLMVCTANRADPALACEVKFPSFFQHTVLRDETNNPTRIERRFSLRALTVGTGEVRVNARSGNVVREFVAYSTTVVP